MRGLSDGLGVTNLQSSGTTPLPRHNRARKTWKKLGMVPISKLKEVESRNETELYSNECRAIKRKPGRQEVPTILKEQSNKL